MKIGSLKVLLMFISLVIIFNACKKDIDIFTPLSDDQNVILGSEYMVLSVEGKQLMASVFNLQTESNDKLQLNAAFESDTIQNESIFINFIIPSNSVGSYPLSGVPFELNYKGRTILGWDLSVTISEFGANHLDRITGKMSGTINVAGTGIIPIILNFSAKRN